MTFFDIPVRMATTVDGSTWTTRTGLVRIADGTLYPALLHFCESDSNEHYGTELLKDGEFVDLNDPDKPDFLERLGKTKEELYPYHYKYNGPPCWDHHIGEDGWSNS